MLSHPKMNPYWEEGCLKSLRRQSEFRKSPRRYGTGAVFGISRKKSAGKGRRPFI